MFAYKLVAWCTTGERITTAAYTGSSWLHECTGQKAKLEKKEICKPHFSTSARTGVLMQLLGYQTTERQTDRHDAGQFR
jgi:hypothetical protein